MGRRFKERESIDKKEGVTVCVCICLCVNMEVSFAAVRKIYFEGSRKEKYHESIACTVQNLGSTF